MQTQTVQSGCTRPPEVEGREEPSKELSFQEFVELLVRTRPDNQATLNDSNNSRKRAVETILLLKRDESRDSIVRLDTSFKKSQRYTYTFQSEKL